MPSTPSAERSVRAPLAVAERCASPELDDSAAELWLLRLADVDAAQLDLSTLDGEERRRAAALRLPRDRLGYLAAHVLLRQLLGARVGIAPEEVAYYREPCLSCGGPHGRPELDRPPRPLHFSLSRSGDVVLIGIASALIGVDVEALPSREAVNEVSALLHPAEREEIDSAAATQRPAVFARLWTRKEAYLKGVGIGVTHDLAADYLGSEGRAAAPVGWRVVDVAAPAGYAAAAALEAPVSAGAALVD
jgi:4'-phosphopantetheinyl transferase